MPVSRGSQVRTLSRRDARRIAVRAQLLTAARPSGLDELVRHLGMLQVEPTAAVAPSAHVVAWSRLGSSYSTGELDEALDTGRFIELDQRILPAEDIALYRAEMAAWPGTGTLKPWQVESRGWVEANDHTRRDILEKLHDEGPLPSRELPDTTIVPWESSGWNNDRNLRMLLGCMVRRGEVAVAGREGREKLWDLAERVYPEVPAVPLPQAWRVRAERQLRALGIVRPRVTDAVGLRVDVGGLGETVVVDGVRGRWWIDPAYLGPAFRGRAALLSPLDRLVFDRKRTEELFEFDYQLEMYKPAAKRRWGYWAMPILYGDRLVGELDATADREAGVLVVNAVHDDGGWSDACRIAVDRELRDLARWLDLEVEQG
ncbi:MAG: DNA glycosylase AlkZ-like family protein [Actinomycetes bacterium]